MEAGLQLYISQTNIITEHKMTVTTIPHIETDWSCSRKMEAGLHTADKLLQTKLHSCEKHFEDASKYSKTACRPVL